MSTISSYGQLSDGRPIAEVKTLAAAERAPRHVSTDRRTRRIRRPPAVSWRRARALLRHVIPNGDPAAIFDRALDALLTTIERKRLAAANRPRATRQSPSHSRHIPAAVRREVWRRDGA